MAKTKKTVAKKAAPKKAAVGNGSEAQRRAAALAQGGAAEEPVNVSGTLGRLALIRGKFTPLTAQESAEFMSQHDQAACLKRGKLTKANDIFRIGTNWALTMGAHPNDPGLSTLAARWFLDCLTSLGHQLDGRASSSVPSQVTAFDDVERKADTLLASTKRRLQSASGTNPAYRAMLAQHTKVEGALDTRIALLESLAKLVDTWLKAEQRPPLAASRISADTAQQLRASAAALHHANANRKAPEQIKRDTAAINEMEGRTLFAMRSIWDELATSRREAISDLQLHVSPSLLRGMDVKVKSKAGDGDEAAEDEDTVDADEIDETEDEEDEADEEDEDESTT